MTTIAQDLRGALQTVLDSIPGFPPANMRAYDGKNFSGTPFIPWARISLTTTGGLPFSLNDSDVEFGLFQVSLYYPPEKGTADIEAMADAVKAAYSGRVPLILGAARVWIQSVRRGPLLPEADCIGLPVTVSWRCLTAS